MKSMLKKSWRLYIKLLLVVSIVFWAYMVWDDWVFVKQYGLTLERLGSWVLFYISYCWIAFTFYYWVIAAVVIFLYTRLKKNRDHTQAQQP